MVKNDTSLTFQIFSNFLKYLLSFKYFLIFLKPSYFFENFILLGGTLVFETCQFYGDWFLYFPLFRKEATTVRSENCGLLSCPTPSFFRRNTRTSGEQSVQKSCPAVVIGH